MKQEPRQANYPNLTLDTGSPTPLNKQLYQRIRAAVLAGRLERGARLPSTRALASELGVSRTTTTLAYDQLMAEGFIESAVGRGTVVSRDLPMAPFRAGRSSSGKESADEAVTDPPALSAHVAHLERVALPNPVRRQPGIFRAGEAALDLFPYDVWARLIARRARYSLKKVSRYQALEGYMPLRKAIAARAAITRGVRCEPEQVIITSGSQGAIDLAIRTVLNEGDAAWIEDPGYFGAQGALTVSGARLVPVPVDGQGIDVDAGRALCTEARLVSTTPSHQYPTGVTMSLGRRLALLEWAREQGAWVLEDDYDSEFRFTGRPLEALQGLDQAGRVLYIGSFSKTLFPALRLGYLIAPPALVAPLVATRRFMDMHPPILEQMALTDFLEEGHFARHVRRMQARYHARRDLLRDELNLHFSGFLDVFVPEAGMHMVGWLPERYNDWEIAARAVEAGLEVLPISKYRLGPPGRMGLLFGFASTNEDAIREGVRTLATVINR